MGHVAVEGEEVELGMATEDTAIVSDQFAADLPMTTLLYELGAHMVMLKMDAMVLLVAAMTS